MSKTEKRSGDRERGEDEEWGQRERKEDEERRAKHRIKVDKGKRRMRQTVNNLIANT